LSDWRTKNDPTKRGYGDHYKAEKRSGRNGALPARAGMEPNDRVAGVRERILVDDLETSVPDEFADSVKYHKMSAEAEAVGSHEDAETLDQIGNQEAVHGQLDEHMIVQPDPPGDKKWIQKAVNPEHKGKLTEYVQEHYGKQGFTEKGTIKKEILHDLSHNAEEPVRGEAQFALNVNE